MAATDQTYRHQKALDIVFAVSSIAMLVAVIGMFVQDYNRPWKAEQREFRDVEPALFARPAVQELPDPAKYKAAKEKAKAAAAQREAEIDPKTGRDLPLDERINDFRARKAKDKSPQG